MSRDPKTALKSALTTIAGFRADLAKYHGMANPTELRWLEQDISDALVALQAAEAEKKGAA